MDKIIKRYVFTMDTNEKIVVKKSSLSKAIRYLKNIGEPLNYIVECHSNNKRVPLCYLSHVINRIEHDKENKIC